MTEATKGRLYNLLPAVYRARDSKVGEPLRALLDLIEGEMQLLEKDIEGLYDDWFIETCDDWVIPYIGDLLGVHALHSLSARGANMRGYVANTIAYRRRKGTAAVLEQVSRDATGWPSHAVEFFQLLAVTQHLNHLRLDKGRTACVRNADEIELAGGPFETTAHTLDVRRIATRGGKYNIPNVGIFLWRLQSYPLNRSAARKIGDEGNRYTFDPLGFEIPLYNRPQTEEWIVHLSQEVNAPGPLRRYPLYNELEARCKGEVLQPSYFEPQPVFQIEILLDETPHIVPLKDIFICNMAQWRDPPSSDELESTGDSDQAKRIPVAIDPVMGKMTLPRAISPKEVLVSYSYGLSGDVGAGPYDRTSSIEQALAGEVDWQAAVSKDAEMSEEAADGVVIFKTVQKALDAWKNLDHEGDGGAKVGLIVIMDSRTYKEERLEASVPDGCQLLIVAANWPKPRTKGQFAARGLRPHLQGDMAISGGTSSDSVSDPGELVIDGLMIEGELNVTKGNLSLRVAHSTLKEGVSAGGGIKVDSASLIELTIERSICGPIEINSNDCSLILKESIEYGSIIAEKTAAKIDRCTVLGESNLRRLEAGNCIFLEKVMVKQRQEGCVRFSYLPYDSPSPRRFRCQPDLAVAAEKEELGRDLSDEEKRGVKVRLCPAFTSVRYSDPGYIQLSFASAGEIRTGAEDGSEMGVFGILEQPQRESNLRMALEEYMRFGLEAGIFYVT
jgi:hypothetical protein